MTITQNFDVLISDSTASTNSYSDRYTVTGNAIYNSNTGTEIKLTAGLNPNLVFRYIKKNKMSLLGKRRYETRMKKLEKLALEYMDKGHNALAEKFMNKLIQETKMSEIIGAGIKFYISKKIIDKNKYKVRDGNISDTPFDQYVNVIPDNVLKEKKRVDDINIFDDFVVYHYHCDSAEAKKEKEEPISSEEKLAMKDPILFGICYELPDTLFFIADWEDDYCDLTFSELVDNLDLEDSEVEINKKLN